ncbi:arginase family protein [Diplodia corticola]|uniref:Arginase family protein n=1 Tax=Diplodia corticola TaxID=236234 RepID=A0A1J9QZK8_9PEZI|nr:arginase family protein [Diplodia corticola]OJD33824.1 arginase family protein [Diplodia corticola]
MAGNTLPPDALQPLTVDDTEVPTPTSRVYERMWSSWSYEFLAATLSLVSFSCLVTTLILFDDKPQREWSYHYVTRNAVIAAISTITRASLLGTVAVSLSQNKWTWFSTSPRHGRKLQELETFDNASRGAIGSLQLLGTVKHKHVASLGALVTVFALGLDTFSQNILGLRYDNVLHPGVLGVGAISRSEIYDASNSAPDGWVKGLNFDMKAAISKGPLGGNTPIPSPDCPTGNCTWPVVPGLAVCGGNVPGEAGRIYISHFSIINSAFAEITPEDSLTATECALWFCLRAYNTSIRSGVEHETVESEWDVATPFYPLQYDWFDTRGRRNFTNIPSMSSITDDMVFGATHAVVHMMNVTVSGQITGNVTWGLHGGIFQYGSDNTQSLWNARKDLDSWTKNLALAMTNVIRTNGTNLTKSGSRYAGSATSTEAFIKVRWPWMVYLAAMLLLGLIHFMATVWQVAKGTTFSWKGTPIIPLLLTVESEEGGIECISSDGQLMEEVRDRRVMLRIENGKGWHFSNAF